MFLLPIFTFEPSFSVPFPCSCDLLWYFRSPFYSSFDITLRVAVIAQVSLANVVLLLQVFFSVLYDLYSPLIRLLGPKWRLLLIAYCIFDTEVDNIREATRLLSMLASIPFERIYRFGLVTSTFLTDYYYRFTGIAKTSRYLISQSRITIPPER